MSESEIWKAIPGYEGLYEVSNLGRVKSLGGQKMGLKNGYTSKEKILKQNVYNNGYALIQLCKNKKRKSFTIHRIVMESFYGKSNLDCNHKNGIKTDNNLTNLEYCTTKENCIHASKNGLLNPQKGENHYLAKLKNYQVERIKFINKFYKVEYGYWSKLARSLNVSRKTIGNIKNGISWKQKTILEDK